MKGIRGFLYFTLIALLPLVVLAQGFQTGTIAGTATDQTGGSLPGVTVTVTNQERNTTRTDITDSQGKYRFAALPLGRYTVDAALEGFEKTAKSNVLVEAEKTTELTLLLGLAASTESITVTAQSPVVDPTRVTQTTRLSTQEFEKAPIGRSYQTIMTYAPGVLDVDGDGNANVNGAISASNQYIFDGVDTTDPSTGTFSANLNFEAIQEVNVYTSGISAEYGRATGAVVNVITKSGTNDFEGSFKVIGTNDQWNGQNKTRNMITGGSLRREKIDHNNIRYSGTFGGPILRDRAWFFGAYEKYKPLGSRSNTTVTNEEFSENTNTTLQNYRATFQLTPSQNLWAKYSEDPILGGVDIYSGGGNDLATLTRQDQKGTNYTAQYSGVIGSRLSLEALYAKSKSEIIVSPYAAGGFDNGSAIYDLTTGRYFNGFFFGNDNGTSRPRTQLAGAASYFLNLGRSAHDIKVGVDLESIESTAYLSFTNNRLYYVFNYNADGGTFSPVARLDFIDPGPLTSKGDINALYVRDKFSLGTRLNIEAGIRAEQQNGKNDVGVTILDTNSIAPRLAATFDLAGNGRQLITASAGRFYDFVIQGFIDSQAQNAARADYDEYEFNPDTGAYEFARAVRTANTTTSDRGLSPTSMDELTLGFEQQFGANMGVSVRGIWREWDNLIDDFYRFDAEGNTLTHYENLDEAWRKYRGVQLTFEKRYSNNWSTLANYTYSRSTGNHFASTATTLNDFPGGTCFSTDRTLGTNGVIACDDVNATIDGKAAYDRPHAFNLLGTYGRHIGPANLTIGFGGQYLSGTAYAKQTTVRAYYPDGDLSTETLTYYYAGRGSDRLPDFYQLDLSSEVTFPLFAGSEIGFKGEIFNVTDSQRQIVVNNQSWCNDNTDSCATLRSNYGAATARTSYQAPRSYRITALIRF